TESASETLQGSTAVNQSGVKRPAVHDSVQVDEFIAGEQHLGVLVPRFTASKVGEAECFLARRGEPLVEPCVGVPDAFAIVAARFREFFREGGGAGDDEGDRKSVV